MPSYHFEENDKFPVLLHHIGNDWNQTAVYRPHGYPHFHWLQTESGEGEFYVRDTRILLPEGAGILIRSDIPHLYQTAIATKNWRVNFVSFQGRLIDNLGEMFMQNDYAYIDPIAGRKLQLKIHQLLLRISQTDIPQSEASTSAYDLLINMAVAQKTTFENEQEYIQFVHPAAKIIEDHFQEDLQIQHLADDLFISIQYLTRLFNKYLDTTPTQYLRHVRLTKSKSLLINEPTLKIQDVAYQSGFNDAAYFSKIFRQEIGVTPMAYRHAHEHTT